jgi:hypothetical protein
LPLEFGLKGKIRRAAAFDHGHVSVHNHVLSAGLTHELGAAGIVIAEAKSLPPT